MEFEELELIGRGSFGQIRKVRRITDGQILARKEISYRRMTPKEKEQLIAEFRILKGLHHTNIVGYLHHEHLPDKHLVHLYMDYCGGGDLAGLIQQCKESDERVPERIVWSIFTQLLLALYRCHFGQDAPPLTDLFTTQGDEDEVYPSNVILHRDIKPDNIFLDGDHCVKLGDFGLAKMLDQSHMMANTYVGTPYYMSPEVLLNDVSSPASDIWSLGCVIYELCQLHPPFQAKNHHQLTQRVQDGMYPELPPRYSSTLKRTIQACLDINPHNRPSTATLLRLDIIKLVRKDRMLSEQHQQLLEYQENLKREVDLFEERREEVFQMSQNLEQYRESVEQEYFNNIQSELESVVEQEVERRVRQALADMPIPTPPPPISPTSHRSSPRDISMSFSPSQMTPIKHVKGPRGLAISTPLKRTPLKPLDELPLTNASNPSLTSSGSSHDSDKSASKQRAAPHFHAVYAGFKTPAVKRPAKRTYIDQWDEAPSPFLRRQAAASYD